MLRKSKATTVQQDQVTMILEALKDSDINAAQAIEALEASAAVESEKKSLELGEVKAAAAKAGSGLLSLGRSLVFSGTKLAILGAEKAKSSYTEWDKNKVSRLEAKVAAMTEELNAKKGS